MYNHENQYRCTIIRGKSQKEMDNLLPAYAEIVDKYTPSGKEEFVDNFNKSLAEYLPLASKKTLDNHRTEIAGKLFGMYFSDKNDVILSSERTRKFIEDNDQPAFFKDVCFKMQFPNGMDKISTTIDRIDNGVSIRICSYILDVLNEAKKRGIILNNHDVGYYVINSLDVLQRIAKPSEVVDRIIIDKTSEINRKIDYEGKSSSYNMQHVNEILNYLELANLIITGEHHSLIMNEKERETIDYFIENSMNEPMFNVYTYELSTKEGKEIFDVDWSLYYQKVHGESQFETTAKSLGIPEKKLGTSSGRKDLVEIGNEGEMFVYYYEKDRVSKFNKRLANKVIHLGNTRGLGFDVQSVIAEHGDMSEFVKYIEVKSTKRVTTPDMKTDNWFDTVNLTRNEWVAAMQHKEFYYLYRVYLVRGDIIMYIIKDVYKKYEDKKLRVIPTTYRADISKGAIDSIVTEARGEYNV